MLYAWNKPAQKFEFFYLMINKPEGVIKIIKLSILMI